MSNLNNVIEFLKREVQEREMEWQKERQGYKDEIEDLQQQLEEQKSINKQLTDRLNSIKFAFLPLTDNIKKQSNKKVHHRVKSDTGTFLKNDAPPQHQQRQITQINEKQKKPLLTNFLKELESEESASQSPAIVYQSPINLQLPSAAKINQILINQNTYIKQHHHHQRSSSNGAGTQSILSIFRKQPTIESCSHSVTEREIIVGKELFEQRGSLNGHLDGVRSVVFQNKFMASASEDCTIKLWDLNAIEKMTPQTHLEPIYTIRQHIRPIFSLTPFLQSPLIHLYSAGQDGTIRSFIASNDSSEEMTFSWHAHTDVIWSLKHHPNDQRLLSSSADGSVKMWKSLGMVYQSDLQSKGNNLNLEMLQNPLANFTFKKSMNGLSIPTAIEWICKGLDENIVCGYNDGLSFVIYDVASVKAIQQIRFETDSQLNAQPNKILYNNDLKLQISAHEDQKIRFCDPQSGKLTKTLMAHTDSVTDLCLFQNNIYHMASVSHDCSMRTWDIRKFQCLHEIPAHKQKFDEGIHAISNYNKIVATAGADGIIKIFNYIDVI